jgi:hypothetical protein
MHGSEGGTLSRSQMLALTALCWRFICGSQRKSEHRMDRMLAGLKTMPVTARQLNRSQAAGLTPRLFSHEAPRILGAPLPGYATREMSMAETLKLTQREPMPPLVPNEAAIWSVMMASAGGSVGSRPPSGRSRCAELVTTLEREPSLMTDRTIMMTITPPLVPHPPPPRPSSRSAPWHPGPPGS